MARISEIIHDGLVAARSIIGRVEENHLRTTELSYVPKTLEGFAEWQKRVAAAATAAVKSGPKL